MSIRPLPCAVLALVPALFGGACKTTEPASPTEVTNSKYYLLDLEKNLETPDPMLQFERRQHLHGAITRAEQKEREGHYYVFWWKDKERTPAVVQLEYRQANTGSQVKVKEVAVDRVRRNNKTRFQITGEEYHIDGEVTSWRVSVLRDGQVVASDQSYLW